MKLNTTLWIALAAAGLLAFTAGCGGGDDDTTPPSSGPTGGDGGGDGPEDVPLGDPVGAFTPPGGGDFGDLRGVATSQEFVYVADADILYCYDKSGNFVNALVAPETIQGVAVMPPAPDVDIPGGTQYQVANFPAIVTNPVRNLGYVFVYPPNLDTQTTREEGGNPDGFKNITLPNGDPIDPPVSNPPVPTTCLATYDIAIDRFGSIFVTADIDIKGTTPTPDYPRALQTFNRFNDYLVENPATIQIDPTDPDSEETGVYCFHLFQGGFVCGDGNGAIGPGGVGDMGTLAFDTYFPFNRADLEFTYYAGRFNFTRDYIGVGAMRYNVASDPQYIPPQFVDNQFGFSRVIGETVGSAPGSFNQLPPRDPAGNLEDPDLTNGGPSGMAVNPLTDELFVCDPGNRRLQVFSRGTNDFVRQVGDGFRGTSGSSFVAPSSVAVDYEGNIYVCDVDQLRIIREKLADRNYGNVGGTVRRMDNQTVLAGATVSIGNELGVLALRTTNINGDYLIRNLRTGTYYMSATKFNFDSDTARIQVLNDTTVRADFNLNPNTPPVVGSYTGNIIDASSNLYLDDVTVTVVGTSLTATSDSLGHFLFTTLAPGTYQVIFTKEGYEVLTRDVTIVSGQTTTDSLLQMVPLPL
jgi:hypothetical protein